MSRKHRTKFHAHPQAVQVSGQPAAPGRENNLASGELAGHLARGAAAGAARAVTTWLLEQITAHLE